MELNHSITPLIALGWSEYESKVYSALVNEGKSTASHVAKVSSVPANRVYQILDRLSDKGYVRRIQGKGSPAVFIAKEPGEVLAEIEKEHKSLISDAKNSLDQLLERSTREYNPLAYTISGRKEMNSQLGEIIRNTEHEVLLALDTLAELNLGNIVKGLNRLHNNKARVSILTPPTGINDSYEKEALAKIKPIEVRVSTDPFSNILLISDEEGILFATYSKTSEITEEKNFVGLYTQDINLAKMFRRMFMDSWDRAKVFVDEQD